MPQDVLGLPSWGAAWPAEKALGILVDTRLGMSEQGALAAEKANAVLGHEGRAASKWEGDPAPLLSTVASPGLPSLRDTDLLEKVQQKATKVKKEPEHLSHEESLRQQGLSSLEKKRLRTSHQHPINI